MKEIKRAKISLQSFIDNLDKDGLPEGECERSCVSVFGEVAILGEAVNISYEEQSEEGKVITELKISDGEAILERKGAISSVMVFSESKPYKTVYSLPPYSFDMEIFTRRLELNVSDCGLFLRLVYNMNVGGASKLCRMRLEAEF